MAAVSHAQTPVERGEYLVRGPAGYSDDEIKAMITEGVRPDGTRMLPPMPYGFLAGMTAEDLDAIIAHLRTLPPLPDAG